MTEDRDVSLRGGWIVNFFVRALVGMAIIFFVNYFLDSRGVKLSVGLGPVSFFDIRNARNSGGCAPLRDHALPIFVRISQRKNNLKKAMDISGDQVYNTPYKFS